MFSRRSTIGGIGSLIAALGLPHPVLAGSAPRPPRLRIGDSVGLIEPAGFSDGPFEIEAVKSTIAGMGLIPRTGPHVGSRYGYLAGTDEDRAADINAMFADKSIRAVFAVRGGWGCARLLPYLDWDVIRANPKLLVGFSDITALHLAFAAHAGFPSIHAPNAANSWQATSWESFWRLTFAGETPTFLPWAVRRDDGEPARPVTTIRPGKARGRLLGGNLSVLAALVGTPWLPDFEGAILFLEDVNEAEYRIDRMLSQLALAGILRKLAGVVFGQCRACTIGVPDYIGFTLPQLLDHHVGSLGIPVFLGANIGHVGDQLSIPVGVQAEMDADAGSLRILEPVVA